MKEVKIMTNYVRSDKEMNITKGKIYDAITYDEGKSFDFTNDIGKPCHSRATQTAFLGGGDWIVMEQ